MTDISIRDLRNRGGEVVERAQRGESLRITKAGTPVASLTALPPPALSLAELRRRRAHLPEIDPWLLRREIDELIDPAL